MRRQSDEDRALWEEGQEVVRAAVRKYGRRYAGVSADELESAANEALVIASKPYDPSKGSFRDFVKPAIYGAVVDAGFQARGWRRRGLDLLRALWKRTSIADDVPRLSLTEMIAADAPEPRDAAIEAVQARAATLVFTVVEGDPPPHQEDNLIEREDYARSVAAVRDAIANLDDRERAVIHGVFFEQKTHEALATELGTSTKTVQRILRSARLAMERKLVALGIEQAPKLVDSA